MNRMTIVLSGVFLAFFTGCDGVDLVGDKPGEMPPGDVPMF